MQYTQGKKLKINQKIALARWWGIRLDNEKIKKNFWAKKIQVVLSLFQLNFDRRGGGGAVF